MAFPLSPTNGQTVILNGVTYSYSTSTSAWTRVGLGFTGTVYTLNISNNTAASSTITGALVVKGGVGIGGDLYVGGNITVVGTITGVSTTATNITAGTAGQLHYQSAPGTTAFVSTATTGNFLQANYVGAPTWTTTASMYVNRATVADAVAAGGISGTIGNSQLTGSGAVTVTAGTGMGGGGSVALGSTVTINAVGTTINSTSSAYVLVAADAGKTISITTGGVTIPNAVMSAGNIVSIYNNSGSSQTITQGASLTLQWAGQSTSQTGNRTLGLYGMCTILFITASSAVITGSGLT